MRSPLPLRGFAQHARGSSADRSFLRVRVSAAKTNQEQIVLMITIVLRVARAAGSDTTAMIVNT